MRKADLHTQHQVGHEPNTEDSAALDLSRAIHASESESCVTSWDAQARAQSYFNERGLIATLDETLRLKALRLPNASPYVY